MPPIECYRRLPLKDSSGAEGACSGHWRDLLLSPSLVLDDFSWQDVRPPYPLQTATAWEIAVSVRTHYASRRRPRKGFSCTV